MLQAHSLKIYILYLYAKLKNIPLSRNAQGHIAGSDKVLVVVQVQLRPLLFFTGEPLTKITNVIYKYS